MSLGLFNCRLIQPAGDQLFFLSAVLPHRCQFGQALFSLLVTRPARPRPAGGRRILLVFPSQKGFVLVFRGAKSRRMQKVSLPPFPPRIPRRSTNPTHGFCYRALFANPCSGVEFPAKVEGLFRPHYVTWSEQQKIE